MPVIFPATYSTLCPEALASLVSDRYGLPGVQCQLLTRGVGDTYSIVSGGERSILRVYRSSHRSLPQIKVEIDLLLALRSAGVSVSYPLADLSGTVIQPIDAVEGRRHAVLFTYAPGRSISRLNDNQLRELGRQMAGFHNVSAIIDLGGSRWNYDLSTTLFEPLEKLQPYFLEHPEDHTWLVETARQVEARLAQFDTGRFSTGYCHFDFLPKNFHFEGDKVTFFDFDFLGYGWLVNDLMTFWDHLFLDVYNGRITQEEADGSFAVFVEAYRSCRALSEDELTAIPYLSLGFWLYYMGFHTTHDQFYIYVQPHHLKLRTNFLRKAFTGLLRQDVR
jgi:Ser/Thr protein kinase RdoA (MazF antagonist)